MIKRAFVGMLAFFVYSFVIFCPRVGAINSGVVVSQVQAGAGTTEISITSFTAATKEFISLYNNSDSEIDVTDWCLVNKSSSSFVCVYASEANIAYILPAHSYSTLASESFSAQHSYIPDFLYPVQNSSSGSITANADTISIVDTNGTIIDSIEWKTSLSGGSSYQRKFVTGSIDTLIDTDSLTDFQKVDTISIPVSGLVKHIIPLDVCKNISGIQEIIPEGLIIDAVGNCIPSVDLCSNIDGLQAEMPSGYTYDENNLCMPDVCLNIDDVQTQMPDGYNRLGMSCLLDISPLTLTELLPNPSGDDAGKEYIEIYNPNSYRVDLGQYKFAIGIDSIKYVILPVGLYIDAHSYLKIGNDTLSYIVTNASSKVALLSSDDQLISESQVYTDAGDDMAWALIDQVWQYTNQPTPGAANRPSNVEVEVPTVAVLKPCPQGQYRNPDTNRCRTIAAAGTLLVPCKDGEYRSEETNRCRSLASDIMVVTPCEEGYERNPETNRCRKLQAVSMPLANFAVTPISVHQELGLDIYVLVGVIISGLIYAVWEWRVELADIWNSLVRRQKS